MGEENTSALDATLEGSKDNDAVSLEEEKVTDDEQISTLQLEQEVTNGGAGGNDDIDSDMDAAVIQREGAVWGVCMGEEVTYDGEEAGIQTGISCSRKLALRQTIERDDFDLKSERTNSSNPSVLL
eukprot:CAMPEP_0171299054 /NCGR_PEP_ID=MMETSP0816-20121228/7838_1 /TAXON_ID=420281 /ORGANISM="Proboscia inermis, Strain CCAP1064/1" /LENGTH=125 /DNA_ID=CAMNT_0011774529 /DNA_START=83 /DNA_END=461 /DNA_ORIENTATION=-